MVTNETPSNGDPPVTHEVRFQIDLMTLMLRATQDKLLPQSRGESPEGALNYILHQVNNHYFGYELRPYHYSGVVGRTLEMVGYIKSPDIDLSQAPRIVKGEINIQPIPELTVGSPVRFRVTVDTTKRAENRRGRVPERGCLTEWLKYRVQDTVEVSDVQVLSRRLQDFGGFDRRKKPRFRYYKRPVAELEVTGTITNMDNWKIRLRRGIGRGKGFGLSMVRVLS